MWKSRIIGQGEEQPEQLLANPFNPKYHPQTQEKALVAALENLGWLTSIIVNKTTGHVVDGHARVNAAISKGEETVPVHYVELSEEEEKLALATLDPIGTMFVHDQDLLNDLIKDIDTQSEELQHLLGTLYKETVVQDEPKSNEGKKLTTCPHCGGEF